MTAKTGSCDTCFPFLRERWAEKAKALYRGGGAKAKRPCAAAAIFPVARGAAAGSGRGRCGEGCFRFRCPWSRREVTGPRGEMWRNLQVRGGPGRPAAVGLSVCVCLSVGLSVRRCVCQPPAGRGCSRPRVPAGRCRRRSAPLGAGGDRGGGLSLCRGCCCNALARISRRTISTASRRQVENRIAEKQKFFQEDNGIPVHLKGGLMDSLLYKITMGIAVIGTGYVLYALTVASMPKKQK
ncbi:PREDICTED: uncharacterized protein LOC104566399 [Tinamus guttatus]|uniref:uncharacterized protein LOC104566399 n=1 Tax=Tinamus guttatus TaxID=94827 RepID=UPI00052E9D04|nr:PREDICTED: uncharacterized protein LOC104566399 [Tinamus guttatus]